MTAARPPRASCSTSASEAVASLPPLRNDRLLRALRREAVDRTPVWIMRQAGRYLPEYRATRARAGSFLNLMRSPELATEVTLQPLARVDLDAAILFSDILTIPDALGLGLHFVEGEGPRFERPVRCAADIDALRAPDVERALPYVFDTVRMLRRELAGRVPLIGFSGSPWTLACYMVEGGGSDDFRLVKSLAYTDPAALHRLLALLADAVGDYLAAQAAAGAQALMLFDTWGGVLSTAAYREFSLAYQARVVERLAGSAAARDLPLIAFTKGGGQWLPEQAGIGAAALGVDWTQELGAVRAATGGRVALQGNLDPIALFAPRERIRAEVARVLESYGPGPGHVFNLGHGVLQQTDPEHVRVLVDAVHELSAAYHA